MKTFRLDRGRWKKNKRSSKDERVMGAREVLKPPRGISFGTLNFPRLNRSTAVWCFLSLLPSVRKVAKAHFFPSVYTRDRDVKGAKVTACRKIRIFSGWIVSEIYVSEIISFSFSGIKRFISAVFSCDERRETKFDNIFLFFFFFTKVASFKVSE